MNGVFYWITLAILWGCVGLNLWTIFRGLRLNKRLQVERKLCITMMAACNEFLDAKLTAKLEDENGRND